MRESRKKRAFASELLKSLGESFLGCSVRLCTICRDVRKSISWGIFSAGECIFIKDKIVIFNSKRH